MKLTVNGVDVPLVAEGRNVVRFDLEGAEPCRPFTVLVTGGTLAVRADGGAALTLRGDRDGFISFEGELDPWVVTEVTK